MYVCVCKEDKGKVLLRKVEVVRRATLKERGERQERQERQEVVNGSDLAAWTRWT